MAMAVSGKNRHYRWKEIAARHWLETAKRSGFGEMRSVIEDAIARTPAVIQQVQKIVPTGFPTQIAESILEGIKGTAWQLAEELAGIH
jgi:serine/threonine-protein kinase HipA